MAVPGVFSAARRCCAWLAWSLALLLLVPDPALADGAQLFEQHCAGCHVNGGNIIRRGKTLRLAALERQGLASPEAIAGIAAAGIGQMSGYREQLGDAGVQAVAAWVWQQAQADWPRG
jgi:cytochrome c6